MTNTHDIAALLLRLTLAALFLAHAWLKIFVFTPAGTAGFFLNRLGYRALWLI